MAVRLQRNQNLLQKNHDNLLMPHPLGRATVSPVPHSAPLWIERGFIARSLGRSLSANQ